MKTTDEVRLVASVQSKGGEKNRVVIVSGKRLPYLPLNAIKLRKNPFCLKSTTH